MKIVKAYELADVAPKWWVGLTPEQQKDYIEQHPNSKMAKSHPLFNAAKMGDNIHETLKHPLVGTIKDSNGNTPLHYAAEHSPAARNHPEASIVKNKRGHTPKEHYEKVVKKALSPNWAK